jgi:hypothetical protein
MKKLLIIAIGIVLVSCGNPSKKDHAENKEEAKLDTPCPVSWEKYKPTQEELDFEIENGITEQRPNESTIQQIRYGRIWFEMINPTETEEGIGKCYLRNYRTDGTVESEGYGIYYEHPVADYAMEGTWKFYHCDGNLQEEVEFRNGKRVKY